MHWNRALAARTIARCFVTLAAVMASWPILSQPSPPTRFVVVLDAAHGGDDDGGRLASGQPEKAVTLALNVKLRSLLGARGIEVTTTRESDVAVDTEHRAGTANHAKADACLSLHASESGSGIHLFTSSLAPVKPAHFIAWKTAQAGWVNRSIALAGAMNAALLHAGFNVTLSRTSLQSIDSMTCPALAIELAPARGSDGAVTSEPDDPNYQASLANALATALLEWRMEARQP
jgi:N-acetylmuramoyl-L-alanine amidase